MEKPEASLNIGADNKHGSRCETIKYSDILIWPFEQKGIIT